jgi:hypothetical protein
MSESTTSQTRCARFVQARRNHVVGANCSPISKEIGLQREANGSTQVGHGD